MIRDQGSRLPSPRVTISRRMALETLGRVRSGDFAETALSRAVERENPPPNDRALATELVYGVLRWRDRLDSIVTGCLARPEKKIDPVIKDILRLAVYQLFLLDKIPDHAGVDQAVLQASQFGKHSASFVNAVLRKSLRERSSLDQPPEMEPGQLAVYYSHPEWLVSKWIRTYGINDAIEILRHNNSRNQVELRVNPLKARPAEVAGLLSERGVEVRPVPQMPEALQLVGASGEVGSLPGFQDGLFLVQGLASQMIAPLLNPLPGQRILDACAAPGGKTAQIAALTENRAEVIALDNNAERLAETGRNLDRLGVRSVKLIHGDASDSDFVRELGMFDRILLDAPCTNLGVLRHNPEARYRVSKKSLVEISKRQCALLRSTASLVKPGGVLVYSVCSFSREETCDVIDQFLDHDHNFTVTPIDRNEVITEEFLHARGFFATFPPRRDYDLDGFFAARLSRLR